MAVLACSHISKAFAGQQVLSDVSFHVEYRQKAALVGVNGAGKSTLLKIIVGEQESDCGEVILGKGIRLGYLAQHQDLKDEHTILQSLLHANNDICGMEGRLRILEEKLSGGSESVIEEYTALSGRFEQAGGYAYKSEVMGVLKGLGFDEDSWDKQIMNLSGGEKTRVALGKLLLTKPEVLLLDEPTNHLDINSITWLENYLVSYPGSVLIVCHDRYFLDRVVTKVMELELGKCTSFEGNYSAYAKKKQQLYDAALKQYLKQQLEIKHQEEVIEKLKSFNREKSVRRAESCEKKLDKMELIKKPQTADDAMRLVLEPPVLSGMDVLNCQNISKSYGERKLFENVSFSLRRGEHVALIGGNGTGKTTILKMINDLEQPDTGQIVLGAGVSVAYYDQEHQVLHMEKTLFEEMSDIHPDMNNTQIRNVLAAFLFTGDDVFKQISQLSGGERGRVSLARLMLEKANFLILDEPTNHLDMVSREILENALNNYTGTVLYVSHDRFFINRTASRIIELDMEGLHEYLGNYDYYLEKKGQMSETQTHRSVSAATESKIDWQNKKEETAALRKRQNDLKKTEHEIECLEQELADIEGEMSDDKICSDAVRLMELAKHGDEVKTRLDLLYETWESLAGEDV